MANEQSPIPSDFPGSNPNLPWIQQHPWYRYMPKWMQRGDGQPTQPKPTGPVDSGRGEHIRQFNEEMMRRKRQWDQESQRGIS